MTRDHNLLFGVFAVQLGKVTPVQLMDAAAAWAADTSRDIPSRLVALGILAEPDRDLLQRFVDEAVAAHGGNAERTLANFGGEAQVHRSFRGSIVLSADGMVSIPPTQQTPAAGRAESDLAVDAGSVKGVFETPGRYTELREYARGGMGRVLLVHDDSLGREIALKELLPQLGEVEHQSTLDADADPDGMHPSPVRFSAHILARFLQEARITGQLEHPSIVPVYELGHRRDGSLYYTMKLVRGRSLSKALKECKNLEERLRFLPHFVDLCHAIAYAHSRKIIHRDIKPANVMVGEFGETVVLDWGLAKKKDRQDVHEGEIAGTIHAMNLGDEVAAAKTGYGQILGTPVYMAPEQARGDLAEVDELSDVYALGVVLYEILTGKVPFDGKSTREVLNNVISGSVTTVRSLEKNAPPELAAIAMKSMCKEKSVRYRSAVNLAEEVQRFQSGALVHAHCYSLAEYTRSMCKRHKPMILSGSLAIITVLALSIIYLYVLSRKNGALIDALSRETTARHDADTQRQIADNQRKAAGERLVELDAQRGREWYENQADPVRALFHFAKAAEDSRDNGIDGAFFALWVQQLSRSMPITILKHSGAVSFAQYSPDGQRVVTASSDGTACLWDVHSGKPLINPIRHKSSVRSASFSQDGNYVVTVSSDHARVWKAATGTPLGEPIQEDGPNVSAEFSPDAKWVLTVSLDHARVWEAATGAPLGEPMKHDDIVEFASFSPDGKLVATASDDQTARVWDAATGRPLGDPMKHDNAIDSARFSRDGKYVVTTSWDHTARVWEAATGTPIGEPMKHDDIVEFASFSPDGKLIATASDDQTARVWDAATGRPIGDPMKHNGWVSSVSFSPDGKWLATASKDHTARVWDAATGLPVNGEMRHEKAVWSASFGPDGRYVLTASFDGAARVWDAATGDPVTDSLAHYNSLYSAEFSPDGQSLMTRGADDAVRLWDVIKKDKFKRLVRVDGEIHCASLSPDTKRIVTGSSDGIAQVWDSATGTAVGESMKHVGDVFSATFSPDGQRVVTAGLSGSVRIWEADTGKPILTWEAGQYDYESVRQRMSHSGGVLIYTAEFSPDGKMVLTASNYGTARIWDAYTGAMIGSPISNDGLMYSAMFSSDGRQIVTASSDGMARVWDVATGQLATELMGLDSIESASFSPDGKRILARALNEVKVWSSADGSPIGKSITDNDGFSAAAFNHDGRGIITTSYLGIARLWDLTTGAPVGEPIKHGNRIRDSAISLDGNWVLTLSEDLHGSGSELQLWPIGATVKVVPDWIIASPEALTGMRLDGQEEFVQISQGEYAKLRENWFTQVRAAAKSGDEAAQFVIRRWNPELGGIWTAGPGRG